MARLTLNGMYEYEPSIFDGMILPEDYDKPTLLFEILQRSGQLYPYHQQPLILKEGIRLWFARNYLNFDRTMAALTAEYNPIENYDRNEKWRRTPDLTDEERNTGSDTLATSGSDTTASSGTDTDTLSGQDTDTLSGQDTDTLSGQDTDTLSGQDTDTLSGRDTDTLSGSDNVERTHTNYDEATTRTYTGYNEKNVKTGTDTTERTVSAFDGSGYQPAEKTVETFGSVQDSKDITGSYKDDKKITGSYKDTTTYGKVDTMAYGKVDTTAYGKVDTMAYGKVDTTAYGKVDTMAYGKVDTMTYGKSDTTTYGKTDTQTFGKISTDRHTGKEDFESHIHGNIGVTTSQQMIESELELRKFDIYTDIARRFENEFIVQVY